MHYVYALLFLNALCLCIVIFKCIMFMHHALCFWCISPVSLRCWPRRLTGFLLRRWGTCTVMLDGCRGYSDSATDCVVSDGADVQRVPSRCCREPGLPQSGPHYHSRRGEGPGIVHSLLSQSQRSLCVCTRPLVYDWQAWNRCSYWNKNILIF